MGFGVVFSASLSEVSAELGLDVVTDALAFSNVPVKNTVSSAVLSKGDFLNKHTIYMYSVHTKIH